MGAAVGGSGGVVLVGTGVGGTLVLVGGTLVFVGARVLVGWEGLDDLVLVGREPPLCAAVGVGVADACRLTVGTVTGVEVKVDRNVGISSGVSSI